MQTQVKGSTLLDNIEWKLIISTPYVHCLNWTQCTRWNIGAHQTCFTRMNAIFPLLEMIWMGFIISYKVKLTGGSLPRYCMQRILCPALWDAKKSKNNWGRIGSCIARPTEYCVISQKIMSYAEYCDQICMSPLIHNPETKHFQIYFSRRLEVSKTSCFCNEEGKGVSSLQADEYQYVTLTSLNFCSYLKSQSGNMKAGLCMRLSCWSR